MLTFEREREYKCTISQRCLFRTETNCQVNKTSTVLLVSGCQNVSCRSNQVVEFTLRKIVVLACWCQRTLFYRRLEGLYDESCRRRWNLADVWCTRSCDFSTQKMSYAIRGSRRNERPVLSSARPGTVFQDPSIAGRKNDRISGRAKREVRRVDTHLGGEGQPLLLSARQNLVVVGAADASVAFLD